MDVPRALRGPIARQGWLASAALLAGAGLALAFGLRWPALALALLAGANLAFFRNPRRTAPPGEHLVLSPADGRVVEVAEVEDPDGFVSAPVTRIAIFLSVFNVHVNYAPLSAKVRAVRRTGARFLAAFHRDASAHNVQARLDLETPSGARLAVVQITGLIARRIVSYPVEGDSLERGMPYGLICYGSRMEVYLPAGARVSVGKGDRVRGGKTVLAELAS